MALDSATFDNRYSDALRPHKGPQTEFLASDADLVIYGGAAGGGKSFALLLEPLHYVMDRPEFFAVVFRRTSVQVRAPGGLWDHSMRIYPELGGIPRTTLLEWWWPNGGRVRFAHLEMEQSKLDWQGSAIAMLGFDELTHHTAGQFWYLLSRNRSMSGVKGYVRATCNPDADSWVRNVIHWWINEDTGLPIPERSGVLRWFVRVDEQLVWADAPEVLSERFPWSVPKSLTFIGSTLDDNPTLNRIDPGYRANLMALPLVERERLLGGNWNIRPSAGLYFQRRWVEVVDAVPPLVAVARGWDLAATPETHDNDPDWTTGTRLGRTAEGRYIVLDHVYLRGTPAQVERLLHNTASQDGFGTTVGLPVDPGQAGKAQIESLVRMLAGFTVEFSPETGDKITRFAAFSAQAEVGNVMVLRGDWNERYFRVLEGFPETAHDDDVDSTSRAFHLVSAGRIFVSRAMVEAVRAWGPPQQH